MGDSDSNTPEFTVSELAGSVKRTLEGAFGRVRVRGEITEFKAYPSGHLYFSLKDESAKIRAIVWRTGAARVGLKPENGIEVIATGRLTSYPERSEYQLIVERLDYAGAGALLARIEALKTRLAAEGLFERKRALPVLPLVIGLVTSPKGAVLQDIKTTFARRFPRRLILWGVAVQGEAAAAQIAAAINGFSGLAPGGAVPRPDVIIVARGGGSLEDLMAFNDEAVVRAAAACTIPLISAVGHETDTTLIDFAADRRAPTPTAAAEMAIPPRLELLADLEQKAARLTGGLSRAANAARLRLDRAGGKLPDLPGLLNVARQRLDDRGERLVLGAPNLLAQRRGGLERLAGRLLHPREYIARQGHAASLCGQRLAAAPGPLVAARRAALERLAARLVHPAEAIARRRNAAALLAHRLTTPLPTRLREAGLAVAGLSARLEALSYTATLARGFALVTTDKGVAVTQAARMPAQAIIHFGDGQVAVRRAAPQGVLDL